MTAIDTGTRPPVSAALAEADALGRAERLVSPFGVIAGLRHAPPIRGLSRIDTFNAAAGSGVPGMGVEIHDAILTTGQAFDNPQLARLVAIAEGAERYATGLAPGEPVAWATAADLDGPVIDLATIPRCSETEIQNPAIPYQPLDVSAAMRWARAVDLTTGALTWIPAVMASYRLQNLRPSEKFWYQITTGCAVHTNVAEALVRGICEIIERDSVAISWLQKMALPALRLGRPGDKVSYLLDWCARHYVDAYLFDASTDLAVPTVYCLTIAEHDPCLRQVISSGTSRSMERAAEKALLETIYLRVHLAQRRDQTPPADFGSFRGVTDGARYMARPERAEAFAALLDGHAGRASTGPDPLDPDPVTALRQLIAVLSARKMRAFALDRTTPELGAAGLAAVTVVIPELQPMSLQPLLQYRAHARLYAAPPLMGYRAWPEQDLSQWPQPCA